MHLSKFVNSLFPENGDDNLLLGLCIDNVSIYQKVGVQIDGQSSYHIVFLYALH